MFVSPPQTSPDLVERECQNIHTYINTDRHTYFHTDVQAYIHTYLHT